jgi:hypothetical protein
VLFPVDCRFFRRVQLHIVGGVVHSLTRLRMLGAMAHQHVFSDGSTLHYEEVRIDCGDDLLCAVTRKILYIDLEHVSHADHEHGSRALGAFDTGLKSFIDAYEGTLQTVVDNTRGNSDLKSRQNIIDRSADILKRGELSDVTLVVTSSKCHGWCGKDKTCICPCPEPAK